MTNRIWRAFRQLFGTGKPDDDIELPPKRSFEIGDWKKYDFKIWDVVDWTVEYIIFIDSKLELDYRFHKTIQDIPRFNQAMNQASLLETSISPDAPLSVRIFCKRLIGEAMACALEEDYDNTRTMFESASTFILARSRETSRIWYLTYSALFALPILGIGFLAWICIHNGIETGLGTSFLWLAICGAAGAVGALLSVISRSGALAFDAIAGRKLHFVEAASRITTGMISGVIAGFAIKSGIALKQVFDASQGQYFLLLAACGVGAGERYVGSIISDVNSFGLRGKDSRLTERAPNTRAIPAVAAPKPQPKPKRPRGRRTRKEEEE